jgi:hypothetical protein
LNSHNGHFGSSRTHPAASTSTLGIAIKRCQRSFACK